MKRFIKRFKKQFHYGQKGFTLIELLIVIAVLGALAAVVVPAVSAFLRTANLSAANTESANVRTAAMAYLADNGVFPNTSADFIGGPSGERYISDPPEEVYTFGSSNTTANNNENAGGTSTYPTLLNDTLTPVNVSTISSATTAGKWGDFDWDYSKQSWVK